jgi:Bacterial SH3 domain
MDDRRSREFNTAVMNDGIAEACAFAVTVRQKAEETAQADHPGEAAPAGNRCRVMDPTSTPLNVRTYPNGRIVGAVANGVLVTVLDRSADKAGKQWVYIAEYSSGKSIGWVFREFISCS